MSEKPFVIKVKRDDDQQIELTINWDADWDKWKETFRTILYWASFPNDTINSIFNEDEFGEPICHSVDSLTKED
jgi:hypothetical protein